MELRLLLPWPGKLRRGYLLEMRGENVKLSKFQPSQKSALHFPLPLASLASRNDCSEAVGVPRS